MLYGNDLEGLLPSSLEKHFLLFLPVIYCHWANTWSSAPLFTIIMTRWLEKFACVEFPKNFININNFHLLICTVLINYPFFSSGKHGTLHSMDRLLLHLFIYLNGRMSCTVVVRIRDVCLFILLWWWFCCGVFAAVSRFSLVAAYRLSDCLCGVWDLSSLIKDQTCVLCIERWILNCWIAREVSVLAFRCSCIFMADSS